jgi:hypothetical protein
MSAETPEALAEPYQASLVRPARRRGSPAEMEKRAEFLIDYADRHRPVTVRQLYYQAEVRGLAGIDKTADGYAKIQRQVLELRRDGQLPYSDIADLTRWMRKPTSHDSVEAALQSTARFYRKALWRDSDSYIEIWCEKDALAGVIYPVTAEYDVPLMVSRGFASETFCFEAIAAREDDDRDYNVWYLGDFDRSGRDAARSLAEKLERFAEEKGVAVCFTQLAIKEKDIREFYASNMTALVNLNGVLRLLPARVHKRKTPADKAWPHPYAIELDAIEPDALRTMVREVIERYLPPEQLKTLKTAETSERELLAGLVGALKGAPA